MHIEDPRYLGQTIDVVRLTDPTNGTVTITDDGDAGTITWRADAVHVHEANGTSIVHTVTVTRVGRASPSGELTVEFASRAVSATENVDYSATAGTLTFADGVTTQTIAVEILHDVRCAGRRRRRCAATG